VFFKKYKKGVTALDLLALLNNTHNNSAALREVVDMGRHSCEHPVTQLADV